MADEHALAVLAAQLGEAVARDSLERLEHQDVELATILLLREIKARSARGKCRDVTQAIAPLAEIGEHEQRDVDEVEIDQSPIEIVEGGPADLRAAYCEKIWLDELTCHSSWGQ